MAFDSGQERKSIVINEDVGGYATAAKTALHSSFFYGNFILSFSGSFYVTIAKSVHFRQNQSFLIKY